MGVAEPNSSALRQNALRKGQFPENKHE